MAPSYDTNRRRVLQALGTGLVGGTVLTGSVAAQGNVVSQINRDGHYAWFPFGPANWGRQQHPYDFHDGDSRWLAEPARGGGVRMLAKNIGTSGPPDRSTGFDVHVGPLGELDTITVTSRTVQTQEGTDALLFLGLYLDENGNGEFFHWERTWGNRERALPGLADDEEGVLLVDAGGAVTISDSTTFVLVGRGFTPATFAELQAGDVGNIDGETRAALYVGVVDKEAGGVEEAVVERVEIQRR